MLKNIVNKYERYRMFFSISLHHFKDSLNFRRVRSVLSNRSHNSLVTPNPANDNN